MAKLTNMTKEDLDALTSMLLNEEKEHSEKLQGQSGRSSDYEEGFVNGIKFVREHLLPAYQESEI